MANTYIIDTIGKTRSEEVLDLMLGDVIAEGEFRYVYRCLNNPAFVVKVEKEGAPFNNISEWELWHASCRVAGGKWSRFLAPCHRLSYTGRVMIQSYCKPLKGGLPKRVPSFLDDIKPDNWGMFQGRPVCFDYGWHKGVKTMLQRARLQAPHVEEHGSVAQRRWGKLVKVSKTARPPQTIAPC